MRLIRTGVFETNSSSSHSLALVGRLQKIMSKDATVTDLYGKLRYVPMFDNVVWNVKFCNYLNKAQQLRNSQEKLWFLLTSHYSEYDYVDVFVDEFYKKIKQWLYDIGIDLKEPDDYDDWDSVENVLSQSIVKNTMFQRPEDLYEYLFDNNLIIDIRSIEVDVEEWQYEDNTQRSL